MAISGASRDTLSSGSQASCKPQMVDPAYVPHLLPIHPSYPLPASSSPLSNRLHTIKLTGGASNHLTRNCLPNSSPQVLAASGLVKRDLFSLPNPFAVITTDGSDHRQTTVFKRTLTLTGTRPLSCFVPYLLLSSTIHSSFPSAVTDSTQVQIQVFDQRKSKRNDQGCLGAVSIKVGEVISPATGGQGIPLFLIFPPILLISLRNAGCSCPEP